MLDEELQASKSRLESITQNIPGSMIYQAIMQRDGERKFTYVSDSVKKLYGISLMKPLPMRQKFTVMSMKMTLSCSNKPKIRP